MSEFLLYIPGAHTENSERIVTMEKQPDAFGSRLREERKRLGLDQVAMAAAGGVGLNSQSNYERGKRSPDVDYLLAVAASGVDVVYLLTGQRQHLEEQASSHVAPSTESDEQAVYVLRGQLHRIFDHSTSPREAVQSVFPSAVSA